MLSSRALIGPCVVNFAALSGCRSRCILGGVSGASLVRLHPSDVPLCYTFVLAVVFLCVLCVSCIFCVFCVLCVL